ncbi:MAG TPA: hypothetical protein VGM88_14635 [Kofleriaceae bacterium]
MAVRHVLRLAGWCTLCVAAPVVARTVMARNGVSTGIAIAVAATGALVVWLPRAAHGAFEAGRFARARRRYRLLAAAAFSPSRERAARLSLTGCDVSLGRIAGAAAQLAAFGPATPTERVVWLNNRACALLAAAASPAVDALALADAAVALRPDLPAVQHTRALALIALGRTDEAIAVLDAMRAAGELPASLEALRCRDLALCWEQKAHADYAADYRARAALHAR